MREQMFGCHQHARRADAALRAATVKKGLLQRMKNAVACESLDGFNTRSLSLQNRNETTVDELSIHAHRT